MRAEDLAHRVGVSNQAVHRWLRHGIPRTRIKDVATALSIEPSELYRFVDTDIASELIDYAQDIDLKSGGKKAQRPRVDTTAANGPEATTDEPPAEPAAHTVETHTSDNVFADRRKTVDRRRRQSLAPGTPSRRQVLDRRDTSYRNRTLEWWLKVDYLDGQFDEQSVAQHESFDPIADDYESLTLVEATKDLDAQLTGTDSD